MNYIREKVNNGVENSMMLKCIVTVSVFVCACASNTELTENIRHVENIKMETHRVTTSDLYILTVFRMRSLKKAIRRNRYPVLLFHGLMQSSDRFIEHGRNVSLAYDLVDAGFDVWLANNRGNKYSRNHTYLNPDDPDDKFKFFNFTYEDIGVKDVPAIVDYVLEETETEKLHYIGHSQGGTVFFALNSLRPEYNEKFLTANLLAGAGYQKHFSHVMLQIISSLAEKIYALLLKLGFVEVFPFDSVVWFSSSETVDDLVNSCLSPNNFQNLCQMLHSSKVLGTQGIDVKSSWFAGGGAVKEMILFAQNVNSKRFCRWDYGKRNEEVYGTTEPPNYDLSLITVNTTLHFGMGDALVNYKDVADMAKDMPHVRTRKVARNDFGHSDFTDAFDAKELVYDYIVETLLNFKGDSKPDTVEKKSNQFIKSNSNSSATIQSHSNIELNLSSTTHAPHSSSVDVLRSISRNVSDLSNATFRSSSPKYVSNSVVKNIIYSTNISETSQSVVLDLSTNTPLSYRQNVLDPSTTNIPTSSDLNNLDAMTLDFSNSSRPTLFNFIKSNNSDSSVKNRFKLLPSQSYRRNLTKTNALQSLITKDYSPVTVPATSTKSYINTTLLITAILVVKTV